MLMDDNGRHSIAIGHLSDTGDLKKLRWIIDIMTLLVSSPFPCPVLEKKDYVLKNGITSWNPHLLDGQSAKGGVFSRRAFIVSTIIPHRALALWNNLLTSQLIVQDNVTMKVQSWRHNSPPVVAEVGQAWQLTNTAILPPPPGDPRATYSSPPSYTGVASNNPPGSSQYSRWVPRGIWSWTPRALFSAWAPGTSTLSGRTTWCLWFCYFIFYKILFTATRVICNIVHLRCNIHVAEIVTICSCGSLPHARGAIW